MASLYQRKGSPFWWIKFRDPKDDSTHQDSTGFRIGVGDDTRKARELEARKTLAERQTSRSSKAELWDVWVTPFIADRYKRSPNSKTRYDAAWRTLQIWLEEIDVRLPRQLTYAHCDAYQRWREKPDLENGKYNAGHNTAVLEMKFMALVMQQAVRLGFAVGNPCRELRLQRIPTRKFPKYSNENIQLIVDGIKEEPKEKHAFLWPSFLVAYYHGVRLNETNVNPIKHVRLAAKSDGKRVGSITFFQKGGKTRVKPLHPELRPLFEELISQQAKETFPMPKSFAKEWHTFLIRCGMKALKPNACFHSFRVTVQNRLRMAGIAKEIRKAYLSHDGKEDVNDMYNRIDEDEDDIDIDEMLVCHAPLNKTWTLKDR